eukprot:scaffold80705_cov74-Cyclotella_meneghiniana.AAC.7
MPSTPIHKVREAIKQDLISLRKQAFLPLVKNRNDEHKMSGIEESVSYDVQQDDCPKVKNSVQLIGLDQLNGE